MTDFADIQPPPVHANVLGADQALVGRRFPPQQQIVLYSADDWEGFVQEWAHFCLKKVYQKVQRFSGAGDRGIDIAGFADDQKLQGVWDNYQCKHYDHALYPTDAWPEIGKILWYSFKGEYKPPRRYYFVAPRGVGTTLAAYLADDSRLKAELIANWNKHCCKKITDTVEIVLEGAFATYVDAFNFAVFDSKNALQLIEDHRDCPHHAIRFGGGLPNRPQPDAPPTDIAPTESRYVEQLLAAYADHSKKSVPNVASLKASPSLDEHFGRQRIAFYHAESLRIFARDSVPEGTFESLQDEIHAGVIDIQEGDHPDGYRRVCAVTKAARDLQLTSNPLITRAKSQDRDGICHQLANEDRLRWLKS